MTARETRRAAYWRAVLSGLCPKCYQPATDGKLCRHCREIVRAANMLRYRRKVGIADDAPLSPCGKGRPRFEARETLSQETKQQKENEV